LNNRLRDHLMTSYSTTKGDCYPNTINDALSLMSTFAKQNKDASTEDAVVSYHKTATDTDHEEDIVCDPVVKEVEYEEDDDDNTIISDDDEVNVEDNDTVDDTNHNRVTFNATVMAAVIAEATAKADKDQFLGGSFTQLQDVDDVFDDDEPDIVVCAHVINTNHLDYGYTHGNNPSSNGYPNPHRDFELILYHTSQRVHNRGNVLVVHYDSERPSLISHEYNSPCAESIIDYADAMRLKLKLAGIHESADLMSIFDGQTATEASAVFKTQLNDVHQMGFKTSTVHLLEEETLRHLAHTDYNSIRYSQMIDEIGIDDKRRIFPTANVLLHHVVSAVAINQHRHKPNRWVNKVTHKLITCGITTNEHLESKVISNTLNDHIHEHGMARFHQVLNYNTTLVLF
jgi:hypothetical protein